VNYRVGCGPARRAGYGGSGGFPQGMGAGWAMRGPSHGRLSGMISGLLSHERRLGRVGPQGVAHVAWGPPDRVRDRLSGQVPEGMLAGHGPERAGLVPIARDRCGLVHGVLPWDFRAAVRRAAVMAGAFCRAFSPRVVARGRLLRGVPPAVGAGGGVWSRLRRAGAYWCMGSCQWIFARLSERPVPEGVPVCASALSGEVFLRVLTLHGVSPGTGRRGGRRIGRRTGGAAPPLAHDRERGRGGSVVLGHVAPAPTQVHRMV
jgi:hypothetical protein